MDEPEAEETVRRIRELGTFVIERFGPLSDVEFGFNRASVEWIEGAIERERERRDMSQGVPEGLVNTFGSFVGECIVAATGGQWQWDEQQGDWGVSFPRGGMAFPFAKVWKQFENGLAGGDSILGFYDVAVDYIATGKLK